MHSRLSKLLSALTLLGTLAYSTQNAASAAPPTLSVSGDHLRNSGGQTVRLKGVDLMGNEYDAANGDHSTTSLPYALNWNCNIIRLPINQDYWMGYGATASSYRSRIDSIVSAASARGCYVDIDLHWSDAGYWGQYNGQHNMPDDNSTIAWNDIANHYKNNPAVLFGVYNEPHDINWQLWHDGGTVSNDLKTDGTSWGVSYHTPGIESLIYTIRQAGADNIVIVGGIGYASLLTGVVNFPGTNGGQRPWDPGHNAANPGTQNQNILYDAHIYPFQGTTSSDWDNNITVAHNAGLPIYIGEFGARPGDGDWDTGVLNWIDRNGYSATAWSFYGGNALNDPGNLDLLTDFSSYNPTSWHGQYVKNWLGGGSGQVIANGTYKIISRNSGLALDAYNNGTANGTTVDQYSYGGGNNQRWKVTSLGSGQYSIVNVNANRALDVTGSGGSGTWTELYDANNGANQKWTITATSSGYYRLTPSYNTGLALDVYNAFTGNYSTSSSNGRIDVYNWSGANNQQWAFQTP